MSCKGWECIGYFREYKFLKKWQLIIQDSLNKWHQSWLVTNCVHKSHWWRDCSSLKQMVLSRWWSWCSTDTKPWEILHHGCCQSWLLTCQLPQNCANLGKTFTEWFTFTVISEMLAYMTRGQLDTMCRVDRVSSWGSISCVWCVVAYCC